MFEGLDDIRDDSNLLKEFCNRVLFLIKSIAYERYLEQFEYEDQDELILSPFEQQAYQNAIAEYVQSEEFSELLRSIDNLDQLNIKRHGLFGAQLRVKVIAVQSTEGEFISKPRGVLFRKMLGAVDNLLDSILAAVGAGSALKELKDVAGALPKSRNWRPLNN